MAEATNIEWCDTTWSCWEGCTKVSPGCDHCYAESMNAWLRGGKNWGPGAPRRLYSDAHWAKPIRWNGALFYACAACGWRGDGAAARKLAGDGEGCPVCGDTLSYARRSVFPSVCDPFDNEAPDTERERFWNLIEETPNLDWLLLTKRIGNARRMLPAEWLLPGCWPKHVRVGATIVNQAEADRDVLKLLQLYCPNFLSLEPMLEAVDLHLPFFSEAGMRSVPLVNWVIVGGESGRGARDFQVEWARDIVRQCRDAGVPVLVKQLGAAPAWQGMSSSEEHWPAATRQSDTGRGFFRIHLSDKKGGDILEWPADLRVREFPTHHIE
jgi:protein gp37